MEPQVTRSEISGSMGTRESWGKVEVSGSDIWLARLFLISVFGAGLASYAFGFSPESMALLPCPLHFISGIECPGCGMTRACIALARGDWTQALHYNPLSMGLILFAGAYALAPGSLRQKWARLTPGIRRTTKWAVLASVLLFWVFRIFRNGQI
jgi:hypothetical protein